MGASFGTKPVLQTVHLLDELVKQMPEGVFLKAVTQRGTRIQLVGYAQSNARGSAPSIKSFT